MPELFTARELAIYLKLSHATVMRKAARGEIPATKIGRQFRFDKKEIDRWLSGKVVVRSANILAVDDEPIIGQFLQDMLGREGHRVATALSGVEALGLVEKERFDLIFLDLVMPGLDGSEVFKRIRKIDEHVPVAIITGHPDSELLTKAMEQGPFIVMKKPLDIYEIRKTVYSLTNSGNGGK